MRAALTAWGLLIQATRAIFGSLAEAQADTCVGGSISCAGVPGSRAKNARKSSGSFAPTSTSCPFVRVLHHQPPSVQSHPW